MTAEKAAHGRKEKLRKELFYGNFVVAPFVPLCLSYLSPDGRFLVRAIHELAGADMRVRPRQSCPFTTLLACHCRQVLYAGRKQ